MSQYPGGRRWPRGPVPRPRKIPVRLSDGELAVLGAAAGRMGLSLAAYISRAAMDAAGHRGLRKMRAGSCARPAD